jgi:hypothetical protein
MNDVIRHQWGPAPSGESRHLSVCRRCGLQELSTWCRAPDGRPVEVVTWVAPDGDVLAARPIESQEPPARLAGTLDDLRPYAVTSPASVDVLVHCPGTAEVWQH